MHEKQRDQLVMFGVLVVMTLSAYIITSTTSESMSFASSKKDPITLPVEPLDPITLPVEPLDPITLPVEPLDPPVKPFDPQEQVHDTYRSPQNTDDYLIEKPSLMATLYCDGGTIIDTTDLEAWFMSRNSKMFIVVTRDSTNLNTIVRYFNYTYHTISRIFTSISGFATDLNLPELMYLLMHPGVRYIECDTEVSIGSY
jgi:hypothetical protein